MGEGLPDGGLAPAQQVRQVLPLGVLHHVVHQVEEHQLLVALDLTDDLGPAPGDLVGVLAVLEAPGGQALNKWKGTHKL